LKYSQSKNDEDDLTKFNLFWSLMESLRTPFMPQSGQGGQDARYKVYKIREVATAAYLKYIKPHCDKEYNE